jgi:hypothetical protein
MASTFRSKRPDYVQAMRFTELTKDQVWAFVTCSKCAFRDESGVPMLLINSNQREYRVRFGDWVVKLSDALFAAYTQAEFDSLYEAYPADENDVNDWKVNVEEFTELGIEGADVLFRHCCKVCRNTGDCSPDCRDYPSAEIIELLKRRIVTLQGELKKHTDLLKCGVVTSPGEVKKHG